MNEALNRLLALNKEANRDEYPKKQRNAGRPVVGLLCSYIPAEIVHAAGMLPWRIFGSRSAATPKADVYRPPHTCAFCNHVLEALLAGRYDFLDSVVATSWDQDLVRLWDVWSYLDISPSSYIMHLPLDRTPTHRRQFVKEVRKFAAYIESLIQRAIDPADLLDSIRLYNRARRLLHRVYDLRRQERPGLTGAEALGIALAFQIMPVERFIEELDPLIPWFEERDPGLSAYHPRLLVSSDRLDDPAFISLIEETGCVVAMDDLDTGGRYFWELTEEDGLDSTDRMIDALAERYHGQPASPAMMDWAEQVDQIARWVDAFNIQGVLELPLMYSRSRQMRAPYFKEKLAARKIPSISFERGYQLAGEGQLKTRIGAFVEMLQ
ncbi:MAG: 2-hydroxyacyl-CoA dehydratase family protein [Proteobacteria bacterium]|nr:2-hydroxyacyl-CoA dehydratase family protein [Pseudomonadota bacterium]